jgi:hypothetical protein
MASRMGRYFDIEDMLIVQVVAERMKGDFEIEELLAGQDSVAMETNMLVVSDSWSKPSISVG